MYCSKKGKRFYTIFLILSCCLMLFSTGCSKETNKKNSQSNSERQAISESDYAVDVIDATKEFYVNDFATILSEEQRRELNTKAMNFEKENNGIQVVITTIPSLSEVYQEKSGDSESRKDVSSMTMERYAYSMYLEYGIGSDDMGILILFSEGDREVYMTTGRNMKFYITDDIAGKLIDDYALDDFKQNNFAEGLIKLQNATFEKIKEVVSVENSQASKEEALAKNSNASNEEALVENSNTSNEETLAKNSNVSKEEALAKNSNVSKENVQRGKSNMKLAFGIILGLFVLVVVFFIVYIIKIQKGFKEQYTEMEKKQKASEGNLQKQLIDSQVLNESTVREFEEKEWYLKNEQRKALNEQAENFSVKIENQKKAYEKILNSKEQQIKELESELSSLQQKVQAMLEKINTMEAEAKKSFERFAIAKKVHPELDDEIEEKIMEEQKAAAKKIDDSLKDIFDLQEEYENIPKFREAIDIIKSTDELVSQYMEYSVSRFEEKIRVAKENKYKADAVALDTELNKFLKLPAIPENITVLSDGLQLYSNASDEVIKYLKFNIEDLRLRYKQALEPKNRQEAIEFDKKLTSYQKLKPDRENIAELQEAEQIISSIPLDVMSYMKTRTEKITENLDIAKKAQEEYEVKCDKAEASEVAGILSDIYRRYPNCKAGDYEIFESAYEAYTKLTDRQKKYVSKDVLHSFKHAMEKADKEKQYYKAAKLAEKKAENEIRSIGYSADADDMPKIKRALGFYKNLTLSEQDYFSGELLKRIKKLKRQAEEDEEDRKRKKEERRRSMANSNGLHHHSSNSGHNSYSGKLGGTGRKF